MSAEILTIPCLKDNYAYLIRDDAMGHVALVDAPELEPILAVLEERGWGLDTILITHHHADHNTAVPDLKAKYGARVVGPRAEMDKLPPLDEPVDESIPIVLGRLNVEVMEVPGHTLGHVAYYMPEASAVFTADSLMALGCGRVFEGTPEQMWESLQKFARLPGDTMVYSGHEYSSSNAKFALTVDPENRVLVARVNEISAKRARGEPTVPVKMLIERATNPFLRAAEPALAEAVGMEDAEPAQVFAEIRARKDRF